jgi:hypothetical protein
MLLGILTIVVAVVAALILWNALTTRARVRSHPLLNCCNQSSIKRLPEDSLTRCRIQRACDSFSQAWTALEAGDPDGLILLGMAVEIDEMAMDWKKGLEEKLMMIGDVFHSPCDKNDDYHTKLAEAYVILLLNTLMELYGKPVTTAEEDARSVFFCSVGYHSDFQSDQDRLPDSFIFQ